MAIHKLTPAEQYHRLAGLQGLWRSQALRDKKWADEASREQYLAGNRILARGIRREGNWDVRAARIRKNIQRQDLAAAGIRK